MIHYRVGEVSIKEARAVYRACTLGARRPVDDDTRFSQMLRGANLVVSAWDEDEILGIARCFNGQKLCHLRRGFGGA